MATTSRKKRTTKTGGAKRATRRGKPHVPAPPMPEVAEAETSVRQALAASQKQIDQSLQEIRREMANFQSQVMEAVKTVHSEQEQGLARVKQAMEGALRRTADRPEGEPPRPTAEEREEDSGDDEEPGGATSPSPAAPLRAVAAGVENVRFAVGHAARVIDEAPLAPEIDASIREGVASVEKAVHEAAQPGADATHEGVESVRAAVAGETAAVASAAGGHSR